MDNYDYQAHLRAINARLDKSLQDSRTFMIKLLLSEIVIITAIIWFFVVRH